MWDSDLILILILIIKIKIGKNNTQYFLYPVQPIGMYTPQTYLPKKKQCP